MQELEHQVKGHVRRAFYAPSPRPHLLIPEQLEQLRLLTSAEMDSATPCAVLLVGQPTLARQLRMGIFAAYVAPRIMWRSFLEPDPEGGERG